MTTNECKLFLALSTPTENRLIPFRGTVFMSDNQALTELTEWLEAQGHEPRLLNLSAKSALHVHMDSPVEALVNRLRQADVVELFTELAQDFDPDVLQQTLSEMKKSPQRSKKP